ncbi:antitoxin [Roseateles chitinivorans]|uniref:antitoxin n=1 Tax=Roseateles chitinivorans TaxID=2917965 RepID=UPI003D668907
MDAIEHELIVSLTAFKKQTDTVLKEAKHRPITVLRGGKLAFYVMDPILYEAVMDDLADQAAYRKTIERLSDKSPLVEVDFDDL